MKTSIVKQLEELINAANSDLTYIFRGDDGEAYSIKEAEEKGIKGHIEKNSKDKEDVFKAIFDKERVSDDDIYQLDKTVSKVIAFVFNNLAYMSQAKYLEQYKFICLLVKYGVEFTLPKKNKFYIDYENENPDYKISFNEFIIKNKDRYEAELQISELIKTNDDAKKKARKVSNY